MNTSLTTMDMRHNEYGTGAGEALRSALSTNTRIHTFNEIPLADIREGKITELDLSAKALNAGDAYVLAQLLKVRTLSSSAMMMALSEP